MPRDGNNPQTSGIPKAVREGARAAGGDALELEEAARPRPEDAPDPAGAAAATVMAGAVGARAASADAMSLIQNTAAHLVRGAGEVDADIAATARGAVAGAISAGEAEATIDTNKAAEAAAVGALEAAGASGEAAVEHVKKVVTGFIGDVRPLDKSVFASGRRTP